MVLGKLPVLGRPTDSYLLEQRPTALVTVRWLLFGHFSVVIISLSFLPLSKGR